MKPSTISLNLNSSLLAALLPELEGYAPEHIRITPEKGVPGPSTREVIDLRTYRAQTDDVAIVVNSKSAERLRLESDLPKDSGLQELIPVFEQATTAFTIALAVRERAHTLGLSPIQPSFFPEIHPWGTEHRNILAFFMPYGSQICSDRVLMGKCLQAALDEPVQVMIADPLTLTVAGNRADHCIIDGLSLVGGESVSVAPCLHIAIGPIGVHKLTQYAPGGMQRKFVEEGLLPHWLPEGWEYQLSILVEPENNVFRIAEDEIPLCTDLNTVIPKT